MKYRRTAAALPWILIALGIFATSCSEGDAARSGPASPGQATKDQKRQAVVFGDNFERIRIEAEKADKIEGTLMHVVDDPDASGGKCLEIPDKAGKPEDGKFARAVYKFTVKTAGNYTFWCRRKWYDQCGDTLAVRFDQEGRPPGEAHLFGGSDSKPVRWAWSPVRENGRSIQFTLSAGEHVMEILNREDGPRYDVLLLTDDRDYVPQGLEDY